MYRSHEDDDPLAPAIGIKNAIPLGILCWICLGFIAYLISGLY